MTKYNVELKTYTTEVWADDVFYCAESQIFSFENYVDNTSDESKTVCIIPRENVISISLIEE